ncbi:hypothetical protein FOCC_FOCC015205 [Frankliniella occidentalis]|nr:hypothetical protein FOCC_FOCC015205 [Frankliniella occidentalis]
MPYYNKTRWLQNPEWIQKVAFLVDVSEHLNSLNLSSQGKDNLISDMFQIVIGFERKLEIFVSEIQKGNLFHFSHLKSLGLLSEHFQSECAVTLCNLREKFQSSFHDFRKLEMDIALFSDPFSVNVSDVPAELINATFGICRVGDKTLDFSIDHG